jgi:hypothetical protein
VRGLRTYRAGWQGNDPAFRRPIEVMGTMDRPVPREEQVTGKAEAQEPTRGPLTPQEIEALSSRREEIMDALHARKRAELREQLSEDVIPFGD